MNRSTALVYALLAGDATHDGQVLRRLAPLPVPGPLSTVDGVPTERPIIVDQTHSSVIVGEAYLVKWYGTPVPASSVEQLLRLAEAGFTGTPACHAVLAGPDGTLRALVSAYLPDAEDGWEWGVRDFDTDFGAAVGELAADLHLTLAGEPSFATAADVAQWQRQAYAALDATLAASRGPDGRWLGSVADRIRADLALPDAAGTPLLPGHGDLHIGQVLRWSGGLAVTDFDGNPVAAERGLWQPAARDLAQLLTSLQNLAMIVARQRAGAPLSENLAEASGVWSTTPAALERAAELRGELLRGYRARLAAAGQAELLDERLLRAFEVEQECRELLYSARFRPTWRYAGLGVLRSWYA